ncbi:MAG TPA: hypothetical protein VI298_03150 [Geobacteraceae bacterium]
MTRAFFKTVLNPFMARGMLLVVLLAAFPAPTRAQEFYVLGGAIEDPDTHNKSYSWQLEYLQGLGEHVAATLSYLNEGHLPNHHRDGNSVQLWGRTNLLDRRLSLAAGIGPYYYFDTTGTMVNGSFEDDHGLAGMVSVAATWYTESRWLFQLRTNWVGIGKASETLTAVAGIGYQLDRPPAAGPIPKALPQREKTTGNELTLFLGQTIANSFDSQHSAAASIEYRRGLWRYIDGTVAWLYEGDNRLIRRNGVTTQLWLVREFLDDRLALGAGGGLYFVVDRYRDILDGTGSGRFLSGIITLTGSYRLHPHWDTRISWNRIVTNYDMDTDVILGGIGYRF